MAAWVLFDLDGTLLDTLADIAACGNAVRADHGLAPLPVERYRYLAGQGARWLVEHALTEPGSDPPSELAIDRGLRLFRQRQDAVGLASTQPYDGVPAMLDALAASGLPMGVLSNKPHPATVAAVAERLGRWRFADVRGAEEARPLKPDPAVAVEMAARAGVAASACAFVGDTRVDMETAAGAGMTAIGVTWGFRDEDELRASGATLIAHHPSEVVTLLLDGAASR